MITKLNADQIKIKQALTQLITNPVFINEYNRFRIICLLGSWGDTLSEKDVVFELEGILSREVEGTEMSTRQNNGWKSYSEITPQDKDFPILVIAENEGGSIFIEYGWSRDDSGNMREDFATQWKGIDLPEGYSK